MKTLILLLTVALPIYTYSEITIHVQGFYESHNTKNIYLNNGVKRIVLERKHLNKNALKKIIRNKNLEIDIHVNPLALKGITKKKPKKTTLRKIAAHKKRKAQMNKR